jgi:hypothetical protein
MTLQNVTTFVINPLLTGIFLALSEFGVKKLYFKYIYLPHKLETLHK